MPKCELDLDLLERVHRFKIENRLTTSGAAVKLGLDRTTFWRFCESGRARGDTRALYRKALENRSNNFSAIVADVAVKTVAFTVQTPTSLKGSLADYELKLMRKACESVLALLNVYVAQSLGREN
jgi:hypothetical protein